MKIEYVEYMRDVVYKDPKTHKRTVKKEPFKEFIAPETEKIILDGLAARGIPFKRVVLHDLDCECKGRKFKCRKDSESESVKESIIKPNHPPHVQAWLDSIKLGGSHD